MLALSILWGGCDSCTPKSGGRERSGLGLCAGSGATSFWNTARLEAPSEEIAAGLCDHGPGLPATATEEAYQKILEASAVHARGPLTGEAGPAALQLQGGFVSGPTRTMHLVVRLPPLLNVIDRDPPPIERVAIRIDRVRTATGEELLDPAPAASDSETTLQTALRDDQDYATCGHVAFELVGYTLPGAPPELFLVREIPLRRAASLAEIARVEGTLRLRLPTDVRVHALSPGRWTVEEEGFAVSADPSAGLRALRLVVTGAPESYVAHRALDAAGRTLPIAHLAVSRHEGGAALHVDAIHDGDVATVEVAIADELLSVDLPFTLTGEVESPRAEGARRQGR